MPPTDSTTGALAAAWNLEFAIGLRGLISWGFKNGDVTKNTCLVGGFNPFEEYACQIGSFPQAFLVKMNHHLRFLGL